MRKLAWAALPYAAAVFLAYYLIPIRGLPYYAAALFGVSFVALFFRGNTRRRILIACLAAAVGFGWYALYWALTVGRCEVFDGKELTVTARVTDYSEQTGAYLQIPVRLTDERLPSVKAQYILYTAENCDLEPGDEIRITTKLYVEEKSFLSDGYVMVGFSETMPERIGHWRGSWLYVPQRLCQGLQSACDRCFATDTAPLIKAIMTGDRNDLKQQMQIYTSMQLCGVAHIVAVSGMHVMFLLSLVQLVLGKGRFSSILSLVLLVFFVLMTGAQPSVIRAAVLQALFLLAPLFGRESDNITSLSFALAFLLLRNPMAVGSISLQLSFAACLGLVLLLPPLGKWKQEHIKTGIGAYVADSFICTIGATAFSMPIAALYFGTVPLLSAFVNLLVLSVLEVVFCAGFVLSALYLLLPQAAGFLAVIVDAAVRVCEWIFVGTAKLPFACAYTENPAVVAWLVFLYASMFGTYLLRRCGKNYRYYSPAALSVMLLCAVLLGTHFTARRQSGTGQAGVKLLDVGQGECVLLYDGEATVLVDCGAKNTEINAGSKAVMSLGASGRTSVDMLILTHLHEDHTNGVTALLYRVPVRKLVYYADCDDGDEMFEEILAVAASTGTELCPIYEECGFSVGDMELSLCLPIESEDENERGLVVAADIRGTDVLIMGDMSEDGELALVGAGRAKADILVAGHHGSKYSSSALFLQVLTPEWGLVSVGENSYGHPTDATMARLYANCENVRRTDLDGDITIRIR